MPVRRTSRFLVVVMTLLGFGIMAAFNIQGFKLLVEPIWPAVLDIQQHPWEVNAQGVTYRTAMILFTLLIIALHRRILGWEPRPQALAPESSRLSLVGVTVAAGAAAAVAMTILASPLGGITLIPRWFPKVVATPADTWHWPFVVLLLVPIVLAPIQEEFMMRRYVYGWLRTALGRWPALLLSSALFALLHVGYPLPDMLGVMAWGMVHVLAYEVSGTIAVPIVAHMLWNLAANIPAYAWGWKLLVIGPCVAALWHWIWSDGYRSLTTWRRASESERAA